MPTPSDPALEPFTVPGESRERIERDLASEWDETVRPVEAEAPVTMSVDTRVRPQCFVVRDGGTLAMLYSSESGKEEVSINTCLATSTDAGTTWRDDPANPVLDRVESHWQGRRAFVTGIGRDVANDRWVMATVGDRFEEGTPGIRAAGLWFSDDLVEWTQYEENPVITAETDPAGQAEFFPEGSIPVGAYVRDIQPIHGEWHALVNWRIRPDEDFTGRQHPDRFYRQAVMKSEGDVTGPWRFRTLCFDAGAEPPWIGPSTQVSQPLFVDGCWYAACDTDSGVGFVSSEDYLSWHAVDPDAATPPLQRADGTPFNPSQQFILPPGETTPWRGISGARGTHGDKYAYIYRPA